MNPLLRVQHTWKWTIIQVLRYFSMFVFVTAKIVLEVCTLWDCIADLGLCNVLNAEVARGSHYYSSGLIILIHRLVKKSNNNVSLLFIHSVIYLMTGPTPLPKWFHHIAQSRASSFKWEYPLLSLRSSSSFLRFLPRLLVTCISSFIFPLITCFRRRFRHKMWPIQFAFRFLISCRIFLCSLTLSNTYSFPTWSVQLILSILLQHHISKPSSYFWSAARSVQVSAPYKAMLQM